MKRRIALFLCLLMLAALLPLQMQSAVADTSGKCGNNLYWSFNTSNGILTITGSGAMWDYNFDDCGTPPPWYEHFTSNGQYVNYHGDIKTVILPEGLTRIGTCAFDGCSVKTIMVPASLKSVGLCAFYCGLTDVYYSGTEAQKAQIEIDEYAYGSDYNASFLLANWHYEPKVLTQPKSVTVKSGKTATFKVASTGAGLKYQWYYSKNNGSSWTKLSGKTSASLKVKGSSTTNGYLYRCKITNSKGSATSGSAKLTVSGVKPKIVVQPKSVTVKSGKTATFKVVAAGAGLKYQWYYSKNSGRSWTKWSGKTSASVSVKTTKAKSGFLYRCVVKNSKGSVTSSKAKLTVK